MCRYVILYERVGFIVSDFVANMKSASKHKGKYYIVVNYFLWMFISI